jgi:uncharacterized protein (DUF952 family)
VRIFHIATAADWTAAARAGEYRVSTLGRSLADEGFIHAAYREQVADVYDKFYAGVHEPLVLLHIEPARLTSPLRDERVGDRVFPHVHGPINRQAVVEVQPLDASGRPVTFSGALLREMAWRMAAATLFMVLVTVAVVLAAAAGSPVLTVVAGLVGAALGVLGWRLLAARFG